MLGTLVRPFPRPRPASMLRAIAGSSLDAARLRPEGRAEVVIDLTRLELLPGEEPRRAAELVERVRQQRGSEPGDLISLRAGDLEALAMAFRLPAADLLRRLEPAVQLRELAGPASGT